MITTVLSATSTQPNVAAMSDWLGDGHSEKTITIGHSFTATSERKLNAHEHLFMANDRQQYIYQVLEGVVGIYKMLSDGRRQIVSFRHAGDLIGLEDTGTWEHHGEALCGTKVRCIPISTIDTLISTEPGFGQVLLNTLASDLAETRDQLLSLGRKSAIEKVATFLVRIARRNQRENLDADLLYLPMKRAEIGDHLGLTIETVSRNITKLKTSGLIRLESKNTIRIIDIEALEELANGDG